MSATDYNTPHSSHPRHAYSQSTPFSTDHLHLQVAAAPADTHPHPLHPPSQTQTAFRANGSNLASHVDSKTAALTAGYSPCQRSRAAACDGSQGSKGVSFYPLDSSNSAALASDFASRRCCLSSCGSAPSGPSSLAEGSWLPWKSVGVWLYFGSSKWSIFRNIQECSGIF